MPPSPSNPRHTIEVSAEDYERLRRLCDGFLYTTRWAGELGEPLPEPHRSSKHRGTKTTVTEIRHERALCQRIVGDEPVTYR